MTDSRFKQLINDVIPGRAGARRGASDDPELERRAARAEPSGAPPGRGGAGLARLGMAVSAAALVVVLGLVISSVSSAKRRLTTPGERERPAVAMAQEAEVAYCTADFKQVLERVLHSCG